MDLIFFWNSDFRRDLFNLSCVIALRITIVTSLWLYVESERREDKGESRVRIVSLVLGPCLCASCDFLIKMSAIIRIISGWRIKLYCGIFCFSPRFYGFLPVKRIHHWGNSASVMMDLFKSKLSITMNNKASLNQLTSNH